MQYIIKTMNPTKQAADCLIVGVFAKNQLSAAAKQLDQASKGYITQLLQHGDLIEELGYTLLVSNIPHIASRRVLLVFCGAKDEFTEQAFRKVWSKSIAAIKPLAIKEVVCFLTDLVVKNRDYYWKLRQALEVSAEAFYKFHRFKTINNGKEYSLQKIIFNAQGKAQIHGGELAIKHAVAISEGVKLAKDLGNLPANVCTPSYIAQEAQSLAKEHKAIKITVLEEKDMQKLGMGALLAVSKGSHEPAKLIVMEYNGAAKGKKPVVLVGKGVTFDSGGLSLKTAVGMEEMKYDMCGAASVLGVMKITAILKLPVNFVGIIPTTENLPSGTATKPGDIVTTLSGQTVEIMNTDAEGRLILCDALSYAARFNPEVVIDIATLTGAVIIALGDAASGLMGNYPPLIKALEKAAEQTNDRVWQLPLWEDYQAQIDSNIADMSNVGVGGAKAITAGCFLARFTKSYHWAHLDIAGTAWKSGKDKSATGRSIPLLTQYLLNCAKK